MFSAAAISYTLLSHLVWKVSSMYDVHPSNGDYDIYEAKFFESAEIVCEGHGYSESDCQAIPCCSFQDRQCWSSIGEHPCDAAVEKPDYEDVGVEFVDTPQNEEAIIDTREMTVNESQAFCNTLPRCLGFTFPGRLPDDFSIKLEVSFKSISTINRGWTAFLHHGIKSSPAPAKNVARFRGSLGSLQSEPEPSPEALYTGAILNLVGTTLKGVTQNPEKDVIVNFYAPWCGFCQKFKAQYGKLAENLQHVKTLQIAQIDGTQNTLKDLSINAFPTVILFPAGFRKDRPIKYKGNRSPTDMTHWLQHHATHGNFSETPPKVDDEEESSGLLDSTDEAQEDL
jgi:thiol-disulfide isomerase/thioredoxin